jgi:acyl transferase domain-containing protein/acyl carrier protein
MAGQFPGAPTVEAFWQNLRDGVESLRAYTDAELAQQGVPLELRQHPDYVRVGGLLEQPEWLDAAFFGLTPREAEILDPQQRLFLECAWTAIEAAGYDPARYPGAIGVYGGAAMNSYLINLATHPTLRQSVSQYQLFLASDKDFLTTRVSYKLNLTGPSVTVQTACSTSLVAVHFACQSLIGGECDMALAGGVALSYQAGYLYQAGGIYSPDGHCRAFDAKAQGTVSGSGVGIVVLKRLEDAEAAGDRILAVIKGSATNNDGAGKVSYTAPSITAQAQVIRAAQAVAEVSPDTISYIEAHGTGTALGDPIEVAALRQVFGDQPNSCGMGSVKTNIGHLDTAAGIASLIKTVLALHHRQLPPSLHFQQPNPQIDFDRSPFYINTTLRDWNSPLLRAGVSSFGIGGTNAHVILEAAPAPLPTSPARPWHLLLLSAKTPTALETATANLASHLTQHPTLDLADVAYTLQIGRQAFEHRRVVVCETAAAAAIALPQAPARQAPTSQPAIAFLFPGQGSQRVNMGRTLYETEPIFREAIATACDLLKPHLGLDLCTLLYPSEPEAIDLNQTAYAQPALFVVEYALARLWMAWGIQPSAFLGHSIGEYVAACLAGVFSLEDALYLVAMRGKLMQQQPPGQMLAVWLGAADIQPWLTPDIFLSAINAPQLCVVAGAATAIAQLQAHLDRAGIVYRPLKTSHAFHSPLIAGARSPFLQAVQSVALHPPTQPLLSNVTGTWMTPEQATDPTYWADHLRQPVQFAAGVSELLQDPQRLFLEVGPGNTLSTLVKAQANDRAVFSTLPAPNTEQSDWVTLLTSLGQLWVAGVNVDWDAFYRQERRQRVSLPTYPFERQRYWIASEPAARQAIAPHSSANPEPPPAQWLYQPQWHRLPALPPNSPAPQTWLIFADRTGLGSALADKLSNLGHAVVTVRPGDRFDQPEYRQFTLNPHQPADYSTLLQDLQRRELLPDRVLHLWSLDREICDRPEVNSEATIADFEAAQPLRFYSLLNWTQALNQQRHSAPMQVTIVTTQVHDVTGNEAIDPTQAPILGLAAVIPQEFPHLSVHTLDIENLSQADSLQFLLSECLSPPQAFAIAHRHAQRWQQTIQPLSAAPSTPTLPLRSQGHYLLVGTWEYSLGQILSDYLTQTHTATVTYLPPSPTLSTAIAEAEQHSGPIHGVFYLTPMSHDRSTALISDLTLAHCTYNFETKVHSLLTLHAALQDKPLDFCVLQSSLSTAIGGLGLAAYAAANACIDAIARQQRDSTTPWLAVNWDACQLESASESPSPPGFAAHLLEAALTPAQIGQTLQVLPQRAATAAVLVSKPDLPARIQQWVRFQSSQSPATTHARPQLRSDYIAPRTATEREVAAIWQDLLGIDAIGIQDNFFELGGQSLLAIQAIARLRDTFAVELPLQSVLVEVPTIASIAALIDAQLAPDTDPTADPAAIADLLAEIRALSPAELAAQLAVDPPHRPAP